MTGEEFAQQLEIWRRDLVQDVISHYRAGNQERGQLAFERWKERFTRFLNEHVPNEATRFEQKMQHYGFLIRPGEHPYETFMREDGNTCFAFIDDLAAEVRKGRLAALQAKSFKPSRKFASSPKVFLSYARVDSGSARKLFHDLQEAGAEVWFDQESLIGGQRWKPAIREAIRDCRFFVALLSAKSINKKGYVQKELREALEVLDEYPPSKIFLIPVRLDDCSPIDDRLQNIQWIDMFLDWEAGLARILKAIESQMQ